MRPTLITSFETTISLCPPVLLMTLNTLISCCLHLHLPSHSPMVLSIPTTMSPALGEPNSEERLGNKYFKHLSSF